MHAFVNGHRMPVHVNDGKGQLGKLGFSYHVCPSDQIHVVRFGRKDLYPLYHLFTLMLSIIFNLLRAFYAHRMVHLGEFSILGMGYSLLLFMEHSKHAD